VAWRMAHQNFRPLVGLKGNLTFVILTRADSPLKKPSQLVGQTVCAFAPPNIATLTLYSLFPNPMQQPAVLNVRSLKAPFEGVVSGRCKATITQKVLYEKLNRGPAAGKTKVIWTAAPIPNQAFSVGPRIPRRMQERIREALLSPAGAQATRRMRAGFGNRPLVPVHAAAFVGLDRLLKGVWGFAGTPAAQP
ncbi:MAG TPA: PhnD/SsuA/transferrin family substrate-binding protein, partial [Acidiferrobacteraceae bacterium]|nr:PhnD/SsuA/transferrin family substrate-binding protein [Acidiferrobacteraceae bacterium]